MTKAVTPAAKAYRAALKGPAGARRPKYGNRKVVVDGITFDSAKEGRRYADLKLLERAGEIRDLKLQSPFPLMVNGVLVCTYVADFTYRRADPFLGETVVEDVKGMRTDVYKIKRKLMKAVHNIDVAEV